MERSNRTIFAAIRRHAPGGPKGSDSSFVVPLLTAIIAGLIGFLSNVYVGYLSNKGTLLAETAKANGELKLEQEKFKTQLILEAVKTGDRQKALDNLTFFIDAGFLEDNEGKVRGLISRNILPVLPSLEALHSAERDALTKGDLVKAMDLAGKSLAIARQKEQDPSVLAAETTRLGDLKEAIGDYTSALADYKVGLELLNQSPNPDKGAIAALNDKIKRLRHLMGLDDLPQTK